VILVDGALAAYFTRSGKQLQVFLPEAEPDRSRVARAVATRLRQLAATGERTGLMIAEINGANAADHALANDLREQGFHASTQGFYLPRRRAQVSPLTAAASAEAKARAAVLGAAHTADESDDPPDPDELDGASDA
jgi:hypothetical protein